MPQRGQPWHKQPMISVIIATFQSEETLASTLEGLLPAAVRGLVREVIVADGGSTDATLTIADGWGADVVTAGPLRAARLNAGAQRAKFDWLLFLDAGAVLDPGFERDLEIVMGKVDSGRIAPSAATFRFQIDDEGFAPRAVETATQLTCRALGFAYGAQGLLIPRTLFTELGGYRLIADLEDVDLTCRLGRRRLIRLKRPLVGQGRCYRHTGYARRSLEHLTSLLRYGLTLGGNRVALSQKSPLTAPGG